MFLKICRNIAIEYDHLSLQNLKKLKVVLPESNFVDISEIVMKQRMIKNKEEIQLIRHVAQIADIGGEACEEAFNGGVPEYLVSKHSTHIKVQEIAKRFPESDLMGTRTWFQSGINTDGAHNPLTSKTGQKREFSQPKLFFHDRLILHGIGKDAFSRSCL